jgi:hypothetical protein
MELTFCAGVSIKYLDKSRRGFWQETAQLEET